ncbi:putative 28S rRNA (cytosine-C(5))-methyltransferase [Ascosphaera acerosa]|nr:putative 28S rRNA (cytosine-C(5))-methyltransferase [Ascosphaera acerosa]
MSLYYDAAAILAADATVGGSFKSRVYSAKGIKAPPAQIYALIAECAKWDRVLKEVIENAGVLAAERKLTPLLALLLTHDLLLSRRGVAAPANHPLRVAIERHKTRLRAEFTKLRVRRGCASVADLKKAIVAAADGTDGEPAALRVHPRWVRINNVVTTLQHELDTTFAGFTRVGALADLRDREKQYYLDEHIPDLLAVPQSVELTPLRAYKQGHIILQDKASCFPAYLLLGDDGPSYAGRLIDGCAAPGNKTTHLASLLCAGVQPVVDEPGRNGRAQQDQSWPRIYSCDASKTRSKTLSKMVRVAVGGAGGGASASMDGLVTVLENQDFLALDPADERFAEVTGLLLDPSCSGSGIQARDDMPQLALPQTTLAQAAATNGPLGRKRKRRGRADARSDADGDSSSNNKPDNTSAGNEDDENELAVSAEDTERLIKLSNLQTRIVEHALSFPRATRVTYSTCSVHGLENENVVARVLSSDAARRGGWRLLRRDEQAVGLRKWQQRGVAQSRAAAGPVCDPQGNEISWELTADQLEACLRCYQGDAQGTGGFFVAAFVRDSPGSMDETDETDETETETQGSEEEWQGFSSD